MIGKIKVLLTRYTLEEVKFELLKMIAKIIFPKYRFMWPQLYWWENEEFNEYLDKFGERSKNNTDRRWMLNELLRLTVGISGNTVECGTYKGASSYLVCKFNKSKCSKKCHYIFDSFEGLSRPGSEDGKHWQEGDLYSSEKELKNSLKEFDNYKVFKSWIPDKFYLLEEERFSFVHIDVDLYQPTHDSIEFFYNRLNKGGVFVCDDYGVYTCPGATKAIDDFLVDKPEKMLALNCGGGFFIKGVYTSDSF
ncbi:class I SAM-dependent methyltransferase [Zooshikella marina]|uniref:TylF/MycF/NovP-related O-methyltransferase n=1 Tax=Zooshikella ganghwensis TaxID=202772 RepID=UPI001BAFD9C4|nr:TylF/MycF/NovP-related O-methyltransferase [Zooshikella ganghwensis]MBU2707300.1 class I SAM-dependent methyltransferase [Zooshikella ganghwensis]